MNIKKNLWKSTVSSRGADASIFNLPPGGTLYPGTSKTVFDQNLNLLNSRINAIHKELTYWNLYKITTSVNTSTELDGVVSSLAPGEACIINTNTFTNQDRSYSRGDVIVKLISNEVIHIPSVNNGIYYPAEIKAESGLYTLTYHFATAKPPEGSVWDNSEEEVAPRAAEKMTFANLQASEASYIYGWYREVINNAGEVVVAAGEDPDPFTFDAVYMEETLVYPVIKFFFPVGAAWEEVSLEYSVSLANDKWTVSLTNYEGISGPIMMQVK